MRDASKKCSWPTEELALIVRKTSQLQEAVEVEVSSKPTAPPSVPYRVLNTTIKYDVLLLCLTPANNVHHELQPLPLLNIARKRFHPNSNNSNY